MYFGLMDVACLGGDVYWTDKKVDRKLLGCTPVLIVWNLFFQSHNLFNRFYSSVAEWFMSIQNIKYALMQHLTFVSLTSKGSFI